LRVALVLAAGASRRFGRRDKLKEKLGGRTLLEHAFARAKAARCVRVIVVDPAAGTTKLGLGASLRVGLKALRPVEREVLIFLADMPFAIARRMRLVAGFDAVRPGAMGHPMLVRAEVARRFAKVGDKGLAASLPRDRVKIVRGCEGNLLDIDTPAALRRLRHRIAAPGGAFRLCNREGRCSKQLSGSRLPRR